MVELRGITIDYPDNNKRVKIVTRGEKGDDYTTLAFPSSLPLNEGQIRKFLGNHFNEPPGKIVWPPHVKTPGE